MKYAETFASLRRERSRRVWTESTAGGAPHKPLLLLSVLDLFARGEIRTSFIEPSSALEERFASYWELVTGRSYDGDLVHPFFALKNERVKFWSLVPRRGKENLLINKPDWVRLDLDHLRSCTRGARIDPSLSKLLLVQEYRTTLRQILIEKYFAPSTVLALADFAQDDLPEYPSAVRRQSTLNRLLRDSAEAKSIKRLYDYACQVCQTRLAVSEQPYAEAAHIRPLGKPHDGPDSRDNILCLCPNHHVLLDLGAFSISDELMLIPEGFQLSIRSTHRLNVAHLRYHREKIFGSPKSVVG